MFFLQLGIGNDTHVIVYDNNAASGMYSAGRVWWMFKVSQWGTPITSVHCDVATVQKHNYSALTVEVYTLYISISYLTGTYRQRYLNSLTKY